MRLAVVILVMLGMLAAGAATILVKVVQTGEKKVKTTQVVVAQTDLPARTKLTGENLKLEDVPQRGLPEGYYTSTALLIDRIVLADVAAGRIMTSTLVGQPGVAESLGPGMLAFQVPVSKRDTPVGLLQPGSIVDVQVTFPLRRSAEGDAVVFTLLQQIRVVAMNDDIGALQGQSKTSSVAPRRSSSGSNVVVTLAVSDRQARALGLALKDGRLALLMRNPTDFTLRPVEVMVLKEGRLTAGSRSLDPQDLMMFNQLTALLSGRPVVSDANTPASDTVIDANAPAAVVPAIPVQQPSVQVDLGPVMFEQTGPSTQKVTIIRRQEVEEVELEITDKDKNGDAATEEGDG
jgi:pilus assembly protein CpaB